MFLHNLFIHYSAAVYTSLLIIVTNVILVLSMLTTGVTDTGDTYKFIASIIDTGAKFAAGVTMVNVNLE